jgi:hypothetical protein
MAKDNVNEQYKNASGMKWDGGKLDWSLLPWDVIEKAVVRFTVGKHKYAAWNWTKLDDAQSRYEAAFMRHFVEYKKGNRWDNDENFKDNPSTHLQAALWNMICLVWFELRAIEKENQTKGNNE